MSFKKLSAKDIAALTPEDLAIYNAGLAAFEQAAAEDAAVASGKMRAPKIVKLRGQILSTDVSHDGSATILNVADTQGEMLQVWVNAAFWAIISNRIKLDDYVELSMEERIAGVTQYVDEEDGEKIKFHGEGADKGTKSLSFRNAVRINRALFDRASNTSEEQIKRDIEVLNGAPEHAVSAIATYLQSVRNKALELSAQG